MIEKKQLQREGIEAARTRGKHLGRPRKAVYEIAFRTIAEQIEKGLMTATLGWQKLGVSKSTFYRLAKHCGISL